MPLVAHSGLPSFTRLRQEGQEVLPPGRAEKQDIREMHIGLLNMMPDAALQATERQFLRLIGSCNRIAQFYVHPFTFPEIPRGEAARRHIDQFYHSFEELQGCGLDALILSGANPAQSDISREPFWRPLKEVAQWAKTNVCSVMCSCLATHAIVRQLWGIERYPLPRKRWGVYSNRLTDQYHPLTINIDSRFDAPHSHVYEVNSNQFREAGLIVLAESRESDLHLGVSPDGLRFVFFQGHPEYDAVSLLKEYKREVVRYIDGMRPDFTPPPEHYFFDRAMDVITAYEREVLQHKGDRKKLKPFPEEELSRLVDITWADTGKAMVNNWLGLVYQVANQDRKKVFMDGIDPDDPLGLIAAGKI